MDGKLNELKEKQAEIGDEITLLQKTNKRRDEEAAEIRKLIQECRENLNRMKGLNPGAENLKAPCDEIDLEGIGAGQAGIRDKDGDKEEDKDQDQSKEPTSQSPQGDRGYKSPCREVSPRRNCQDILGKRDGKSDTSKKKKKGKDRVCCKVDLNTMKVRVRGPPEDLKKLDATQLINLLDEFQCQELIINAGNEVIQDPGEIRLIYLLHPGNIVMVAGIIMIAFMINTNICHVKNTSSTKLLFSVLYVGSSAFHYGMVLWMIFIRGYALKFGLCQDTFHFVDNLILPKYYSVCVLLSALSMYSFLATHSIAPCSSWPLDVVAQIILVGMTFFMELITICYVIPAVIKLREATDDYVFDEGDDPDCNVPESYGKNLVKLGKLSWTLCLINFLTLLLLGANIYFITSKLNVGPAN